MKKGQPLIVNLQLGKPTLILSRDADPERVGKSSSSKDVQSAMNLRKQGGDDNVNLSNLRGQRLIAKSPQMNGSFNQSSQRFNRKTSQPLITSQSVHKFKG